MGCGAMAGTGAVPPQPSALAAAGKAHGQHGEANNRNRALMHNESLPRRRVARAGFDPAQDARPRRRPGRKLINRDR